MGINLYRVDTIDIWPLEKFVEKMCCFSQKISDLFYSIWEYFYMQIHYFLLICYNILTEKMPREDQNMSNYRHKNCWMRARHTPVQSQLKT